MDHSTPTLPRGADGKLPYYTPASEAQVDMLARNCADYGIELFDMGSDNRGIVHVIAPEQGFTQPGMTIVCGDSHTSTHGAFGALAFGIGTSEVGHVLATQCLLQRKAKTMAITVDGPLAPGVGAKDVDPAHHRRDRGQRRHRPRAGVPRFHHRRDGHGTAHDPVQHVDRGRRARRHGRAGTRSPSTGSPRPRAAPRGPTSRPPCSAGRSCKAIPARASTPRCASTRATSARP